MATRNVEVTLGRRSLFDELASHKQANRHEYEALQSPYSAI